jgi:hypothetical protein
VFYDDVLYTKNDWRNRNRIKTPQGPLWLTIPVSSKDRIRKQLLIHQVLIQNTLILKEHLKTIEHNYKKAPYFDKVYNLLTASMNKRYDYLADLTIDLIIGISRYLKISTVSFFRSSEIDITDSNPTQRLVEICRHFKATNYTTGASARNYLDEKLFSKNSIKLTYQDYKHPEYRQQWGKFIPYLSIVDLLFNYGSDSLKILSHD